MATSTNRKTAESTEAVQKLRPVILFVGLHREFDSQIKSIKQSFEENPDCLVKTVWPEDLDSSSLANVFQRLEVIQSRIEVLHLCGPAYGASSSENVDPDFLDSLSQFISHVNPKLLVASCLSDEASQMITDLAKKKDLGCAILVGRDQGPTSTRLQERFYSEMLAGKTVEDAYDGVSTAIRRATGDSSFNLPWNIVGSDRGFSLLTETKSETTNWFSRVFGRPRIKQKESVAILIQANAALDLKFSKEEVYKIGSILNRSPYCRAVLIEDATVEKVRDCLRQYGEKVEIIHYAGHANGQALLLESETDGADEPAYIRGLAAEFKRTKPKLIFINGCSSQQQAVELQDIPDRAWAVMTDTAINDSCANDFSTTFYEAIKNGNTIEQAFARTTETIEHALQPKSTSAALNYLYRPRAVFHDDENERERVHPVFRSMPWKIYRGAQIWRLGMTELERDVNSWNPDWKLWDVPFVFGPYRGFGFTSPRGAFLAFLGCLVVGFFAWLNVLRGPVQPVWIDPIESNQLTVNVKQLENLHKNQNHSGEAKVDFHMGQTELGLLRRGLWYVEKRNRKQPGQVKLVLSADTKEEMLQAIVQPKLPLLSSPTLGPVSIFCAVTGVIMLLVLVRSLQGFGCWYVHNSGGRRKQADAAHEVDFFKWFYQKFWGIVNFEKKATTFVALGLCAVTPLFVLPFNDLFFPANNIASEVTEIEFDGAGSNDNSIVLPGGLASYFPKLKTIRFRNSRVTDQALSRLAEFEKARTKCTKDGRLQIDVSTSAMGGNNTFVNERFVWGDYKRKECPAFFELLDNEKRDLQNQQARDFDGVEKYLELNFKSGALTIKDWPELHQADSEKQEREKLLQKLRHSIEQISRLAQIRQPSIHILPTATASSTDTGVEKCTITQLLNEIARTPIILDRIRELNLTGHALSSSSGFGAMHTLKLFTQLNKLNVTDTGLDKKDLAKLLRGGLDSSEEYPFGKLHTLICPQNNFGPDELSEVMGARLTGQGVVKLKCLRSDCWANPQEKPWHEFQAEVRDNESIYGKITVNFRQSKNRSEKPSRDIEIYPTQIKLTNGYAIKTALPYFSEVDELILDFKGKYQQEDVAELNNLHDFVPKERLSISQIGGAKSFVESLLNNGNLLSKPASLKLERISSKVEELKLEQLNSSGRLRSLEVESPASAVKIDQLRTDLDFLRIDSSNVEGLTREGRLFQIGDVAPPQKIKFISAINTLVDLELVERLISYSPPTAAAEKPVLDLSKSEWERKEFDHEKFKDLLQQTQSNTRVFLPYVKCSDVPKLQMPVATTSEFEKVFTDLEPLEFLFRTRILAKSGQIKVAGRPFALTETTLSLFGNREDIERTFKWLAKVEANRMPLINNIVIKTTENDSAELGKMFSHISNEMNQLIKKHESNWNIRFPQLPKINGRKDVRHAPDQFGFHQIVVKGESVGDELPSNLRLKSSSYHFKGCPDITPGGLKELANYWTSNGGKACSQDGKTRVYVSGQNGVGEIDSELIEGDVHEGFVVDYSDSLITQQEQNELAKVKIFDRESLLVSTWLDGQARSEKYKKQWNLNKTIESFLGNQRHRERALVLAQSTGFDDLTETQVAPGYWPLILRTQAEILSQRGETFDAWKKIERANELASTIRKADWSEERMKLERERYRKLLALEEEIRKYEAQRILYK